MPSSRATGRSRSSWPAQAREHGIWLIGGTLPLGRRRRRQGAQHDAGLRPARPARSARYDKIHLFGFDKGDESYDEARTIVPGDDGRQLRGAVRPGRPVGLLRPALSRAVPGDGRMRADRGAGRIHLHHRPGALGSAAARPRDREPVLRAGRGAGRQAPERPPHLRATACWSTRGARSRRVLRGRRGRGQRRDRCRDFLRRACAQSLPAPASTASCSAAAGAWNAACRTRADMAQCPIHHQKDLTQ